MALFVPASLDHESPAIEEPGADCRAPRAPHRRRERVRTGGKIVELGDSARDGQCELCSGAQSGVARDGATNANAHGVAQSLRCEIPSRKFRRAVRLRPLAFDRLGALDFELQRRVENAGADPAEAAAERAAEIEHAEVESRGRFDANDALQTPEPCAVALSASLFSM